MKDLKYTVLAYPTICWILQPCQWWPCLTSKHSISLTMSFTLNAYIYVCVCVCVEEGGGVAKKGSPCFATILTVAGSARILVQWQKDRSFFSSRFPSSSFSTSSTSFGRWQSEIYFFLWLFFLLLLQLRLIAYNVRAPLRAFVLDFFRGTAKKAKERERVKEEWQIRKCENPSWRQEKCRCR